MRTFSHILFNNLLVTLANFFVWFAVQFWLYLETQSVVANAALGGIFMTLVAVSGVWLGSLVDHNRKRKVMIASSAATALAFALALALYLLVPREQFMRLDGVFLWSFVGLILLGVIAGNLRGIALATTVTLLVPPGERDKANGMVGMVMGLSSFGAGIASGFAVAYLGLPWIVVIGIAAAAGSIVHILFHDIPEPALARSTEIGHSQTAPRRRMDLRGTIALIRQIPGLFALIFFTTFNNFVGGTFMALMDPYGLSLMSVEAWGVTWGVLSMGFVLGGVYISRKGLGPRPLSTLFVANIIIWLTCLIFPVQPSIILLAASILIWTALSPFIEATEQTIIQRVVPLERQGRVFGFAQSIESAVTPITAFLIGPLAQFVFIPFMTTGAGVTLIGGWFGSGPGRGMGLVFMLAALLGLVVTLLSMRAPAYKRLAEYYDSVEPPPSSLTALPP